MEKLIRKGIGRFAQNIAWEKHKPIHDILIILLPNHYDAQSSNFAIMLFSTLINVLIND